MNEIILLPTLLKVNCFIHTDMDGNSIHWKNYFQETS